MDLSLFDSCLMIFCAATKRLQQQLVYLKRSLFCKVPPDETSFNCPTSASYLQITQQA